MQAVDAMTKRNKLLSYTVASSEMRSISINERDVYLVRNADQGWLIRGELPGCGESCHANLAIILLEQAMSCENCRDAQIAWQENLSFGQQLGNRLATILKPVYPGISKINQIDEFMEILLASLDVSFQKEVSSEESAYTLVGCPFANAGQSNGLTQWLLMSRLAFIGLVTTLLKENTPEWKLAYPQEDNITEPVTRLVIRQETA